MLNTMITLNRPGISFLNIGSGTGYLSYLASLLLQDDTSDSSALSVNHGIELQPEMVSHAEACIARTDKELNRQADIQVSCSSVRDHSTSFKLLCLTHAHVVLHSLQLAAVR
jgi:tRNA1(Val) A37 N6-methylase TrmN6